MRTEVFLKKEEVTEHKEFVKKEREKDGEKWNMYFLGGTQIFAERGKFYMSLPHVEDRVPDWIETMVDEISFYDLINANPKRVRGKYELGQAVGTLDRTSSRNDSYSLSIWSPSLKDMRKLYYEIRKGLILPTESWEKEQGV